MIRHSPGVVAEEAADMLAYGFEPWEIAHCLGIQLESVARACKRAGRLELFEQLNEAVKADRKAVKECLSRAA